MTPELPSDAVLGKVTGALARALRTLLRPLVRLLLEKQIPFPYVAELLKAVYVEVADREFVIAGRRQTDSRISLLSGVHRKDVKRLRSALAAEEPIPGAVSLGALLVSRWLGDPAYLDDAGRPRPLPRLGGAGRGPSFESLVASVSKDIPARSILDEWLRLGVAECGEDGQVRLRAESFVPERGLEEKIHFFGRNLHDHIATGARNLLGGDPPFLDRSVFYDRLSRDSADALAQLAREQGEELLRRLNRRALELQSQDAGDTAATHRMTTGVYFHAVDTRSEPDTRRDETDDDAA